MDDNEAKSEVERCLVDMVANTQGEPLLNKVAKDVADPHRRNKLLLLCKELTEQCKMSPEQIVYLSFGMAVSACLTTEIEGMVEKITPKIMIH